MNARVLSVANQKGGVGKTTTALTLGAALVRHGKKVLVMDLDPHANASVHLSFFPENLEATAYDLIHQEAGETGVWERIIQTRVDFGFDFVPGHIRLSELEVDLKERPNKGLILREALSAVRSRYDYILIDCPPHVGILLVNALVASDLVVIPIQTDFLALYGIRLLFDTIRMLNRVLPRAVRYKALPTMFDQRAGACRRVLNLIRRKLEDKTFETVIHLDTKFRDACVRGRVIYDIAPDSRGALEYMQLAGEVIRDENA